MKTTPELHTRRLRLRPFARSDADDVRRLAGDRRVADNTLNIPHPYEPGIAEDWIDGHPAAAIEGRQHVFAITMRDGGALVGAMGLIIEPRFFRAELGYWIGVPYWGNGYCTEAGRAVIAFAFDRLRLHRVYATHLARNPASGRVMQKLGMQREGVAVEHAWKRGVFEDLVLYGLVAPAKNADVEPA